MESTLTMVFITSNEEKASISIDGVKETLTKEETNALMDTIIEKDIFFTKNGALVSKHSAALVQRQVTKLDIA